MCRKKVSEQSQQRSSPLVALIFSRLPTSVSIRDAAYSTQPNVAVFPVEHFSVVSYRPSGTGTGLRVPGNSHVFRAVRRSVDQPLLCASGIYTPDRSVQI